jgi:hypothetical protein
MRLNSDFSPLNVYAASKGMPLKARLTSKSS